MNRELADVCLAAALEGARVLRERYSLPRDIHYKGRIDLVTDADRAAEEAVLKVLRALAPGVRILAEESGASGAGDTCFFVDPLDGTTNYAHGIPIFCCTVGAERDGEVVAGCTPRKAAAPCCATGRVSGPCASRGRRTCRAPSSAPASLTAIATCCRA